jgi:hypothetical protein
VAFGQLRALKEPSVWELCKTHRTPTYRFLWLRAFHRPISVRLDITMNGLVLLTTKATTGQGGYKPGSQVVNKTGALTKGANEFGLSTELTPLVSGVIFR